MILKVSQGKPFPLGSSYDGRGTNFSIFSANATKVLQNKHITAATQIIVFKNFFVMFIRLKIS